MSNLFFIRVTLTVSLIIMIAYSCNTSNGNPVAQPDTQELKVVSLKPFPATTFQEYTAFIEGTRDIDIRAQVDGYVDEIYFDEGAFVKKGSTLFEINDRPYREKLNNAKATLAAAKANEANARLNVSKLEPLVTNNVISDVQLKAAKAASDAAKAAVAQAEAMEANARVDLDFTTVKAPTDGYLGRMPLRKGSLVGTNVLTVLSEIRNVYAYFSMSEKEFLNFENQMVGRSMKEKIGHIPGIELILADNSVYPVKGKIEMVSGQFNQGTGGIAFRAVFENKDGLLRSGNTGKIRIPQTSTAAVVVPKESTFEIQDKVFVFAVSDSNTVSMHPLDIKSSAGNYYLLKPGEIEGSRIVYEGQDRLRDGMKIRPQPISLDSLVGAKPI